MYWQHRRSAHNLVAAVGFLSIHLAQLNEVGLVDEVLRRLHGSYELCDRSARAGRSTVNPPSLDARLLKVNVELSRLVDPKVEVEDVTLKEWRALVNEAAPPTPNIEEHLGRYTWSLVTGKARARAKASNETAKRMLQDFDGAKAETEGMSAEELETIAGHYRRISEMLCKQYDLPTPSRNDHGMDELYWEKGAPTVKILLFSLHALAQALLDWDDLVERGILQWMPDGGGSWMWVPVYMMEQRRVNGSRCPETLWPLSFAGRRNDPLAPTIFARLDHTTPIVSVEVLKLRIATMDQAGLDLLLSDRINATTQSRWFNYQIKSTIRSSRGQSARSS